LSDVALPQKEATLIADSFGMLNRLVFADLLGHGVNIVSWKTIFPPAMVIQTLVLPISS
jgi:hypothetical protein